MADNYKILAQNTAKSVSSKTTISFVAEEILNHVGIFGTFTEPYIINLDSYTGTLPVPGDVYYIDNPIMEGVALVDTGSTAVFWPEVYIVFELQDESPENTQALSDYFATNPQSLVLTALAPVTSFENQANIIYTVPENTQAAISSVSLINSSVTSEDYYLGVVKAEDVENSVIPERVYPFVAITSNINAAYSTDGITWTRTTLPVSASWQSITHGDGKFVAVASATSTAAYSTDGITWTETTLPANASWYSVTHGDGKFVAIASFNDAAAYSTDGITWTQTAMPSSASWYSVTHGDGKFVALSYNSNKAAYSTDGITWTQTAMPTSALWGSVTHGDGKFVAVTDYGNDTTAAYSTDGITWTQTTLPTSTNWSSVTYGDGKFVVVALNSTAAYSTDGISWTQTTLPTLVNAGWQSVTHGDGKFVAVAYATATAAYSTDGITWTQTTMPLGASWYSVTHGAVIPAKNVILQSQTIIPTRSIEPNTVDEITGGITLSAGDQIRVYSESEDLIVQVYGVEIV